MKPFIVWLQLHCLKKSLRWFWLWPSGIFSQLSSSKNVFIASFCFWEANGFSPPRDHHGNKTNVKWTSYMFYNELYTCSHPCTVTLVFSLVCHVCECTGGYEGLWPVSSFSFCVSVSRISFLPAPPLLLHCALLPLHIELTAEPRGPLHTNRVYARASVSDQTLEDSSWIRNHVSYVFWSIFWNKSWVIMTFLVDILSPMRF